MPGLPRIGRKPGEGPEPDALGVDAEQVGEPAHGGARLRAQPAGTVQQVLGGVVGGISDERLGIDDEPRLALRPKDVAGVQVGPQQHVTS